jgi:large repetitive protein
MAGTSAPRCSLDGATFERCRSPWRYTGLADGAHTFRVRVSRAGGAETAWHSWRIDSVGPTTPRVTGGSREWHNRAVTVTAHSTDAGSGIAAYVRRVSRYGGATWSRPLRGGVATVWREGSTLVRFQAVDTAGNRSPWSAPALVKLDLTPPTQPGVATTGRTLGQWQNVESLTFTAMARDELSGVASYGWRNEGIQHGAGNGPTAVITGEGMAYMVMWAIDRAGNYSPAAYVAAGIDRTAPVIIDVRFPAGWQNARGFYVDAHEMADVRPRYEYRDANDPTAAWAPAPTFGVNVYVPGEGERLIELRPVDSAGNIGPSVFGWLRQDLTPPTPPTVTGGSGLDTSAASATLTALSGVAGHRYAVRTPDGVTVSAAAGDTVTLTEPGQFVVTFAATDAAGNWSDYAPDQPGAANSVCIE